MSDTLQVCACEFKSKTLGLFTAAWHRRHRTAHLKAFPLADERTRDALDQDVRLAERREAS